MEAKENALRLRPARPAEAGTLSALALRSKAVWGYDDDFLEACRPELTVTSGMIEAGGLTVAERDGRVVGLSRVAIGNDGTAEILLLFVEPGQLRGGIGRGLFAALEKTARAAGAVRLCCGADPGAEPFYRRMGMIRIGEEPSGSITGRMLPRLEKRL